MLSPEKLLPELIALPSINPAFLPAGHPQAGERRVAEFLAEIAARAGLDIQWQAALPGRSNLLARLAPGRRAAARVLLVPHLDTVNAAPQQLTPKRQHGRLYGRGACDTKGSVASMLAALCQLARSGPRPARTEIVFAGLIDEENAQTGSRFLAGSGLSADLAIVGEPTQLRVVTAHKGSLWLRYETRGKSAHGAKPELGRNAILEMARVVEVLETRYAALLRQRQHPLLGRPTVNVGVIHGGSQPNIVPDRCFVEVDRRTLPGETEAGVTREILSLLRQHQLKALASNSKQASCPPMETDPALPMVRRFLSALDQKRPAGVDYFCDAAILSQAGIPSVVFGPGNIAQAHTADEWISLRQLKDAAALLLRFLRALP